MLSVCSIFFDISVHTNCHQHDGMMVAQCLLDFFEVLTVVGHSWPNSYDIAQHFEMHQPVVYTDYWRCHPSCSYMPLAWCGSTCRFYLAHFTDVSDLNRLGHTKCKEGMDLTALNKFHHWFHKGISHWLCISKYKALHGIQKAVQMDNIVPDYTDTKYSSSAYDILQLFDQVIITFIVILVAILSGIKNNIFVTSKFCIITRFLITE